MAAFGPLGQDSAWGEHPPRGGEGVSQSYGFQGSSSGKIEESQLVIDLYVLVVDAGDQIIRASHRT